MGIAYGQHIRAVHTAHVAPELIQIPPLGTRMVRVGDRVRDRVSALLRSVHLGSTLAMPPVAL